MSKLSKRIVHLRQQHPEKPEPVRAGSLALLDLDLLRDFFVPVQASEVK
jgi:hypothetical protein